MLQFLLPHLSRLNRPARDLCTSLYLSLRCPRSRVNPSHSALFVFAWCARRCVSCSAPNRLITSFSRPYTRSGCPHRLRCLLACLYLILCPCFISRRKPARGKNVCATGDALRDVRVYECAYRARSMCMRVHACTYSGKGKRETGRLCPVSSLFLSLYERDKGWKRETNACTVLWNRTELLSVDALSFPPFVSFSLTPSYFYPPLVLRLTLSLSNPSLSVTGRWCAIYVCIVHAMMWVHASARALYLRESRGGALAGCVRRNQSRANGNGRERGFDLKVDRNVSHDARR